MENLKSLETVSDNVILDRFHQFIQDPLSSFCKELKKFGGPYSAKCKYTDGGKFTCMDDLLVDIQNNECLIYSFGIDKDWTFEDAMSDFGCKVYAHDPTVNFPRHRGANIIFEKVGLASKADTENNLKDLKTIIAENGHSESKISYLKMDIEGVSALINNMIVQFLHNDQMVDITTVTTEIGKPNSATNLGSLVCGNASSVPVKIIT